MDSYPVCQYMEFQTKQERDHPPLVKMSFVEHKWSRAGTCYYLNGPGLGLSAVLYMATAVWFATANYTNNTLSCYQYELLLCLYHMVVLQWYELSSE
jgi:hypothetical protein